MTYQIGLCDDEIYQIKVNSLFLREIVEKNNIDLEYHGFAGGRQLKKYLSGKQLDILFMDIDLGKESGVELATQLSHQYPEMMIVFVTGHKEFMEEAFEIDAMGYLVKPFEIKRLESTLRKSILQISAMRRIHNSREIVVTDENLKKKILCRDIIYIQKQQYQSIIVTREKEYHVYEPITSLYERIGEGFLRVNQSEVVNRDYIKGISGNIVQLKNKIEMPIGRTYRKEFKRLYFGT